MSAFIQTATLLWRRATALLLLLAFVVGSPLPMAVAGGHAEPAAEASCDASHCGDTGNEPSGEDSEPCGSGHACCKCPCHAQIAIPAAHSAMSHAAMFGRATITGCSEDADEGRAYPPDLPPRTPSE